MTAAELIEHLRALDPATVATVLDINEDECHVLSPLTSRQFTVLLEAGDVVTEEDLA